MKTIAIAKGQYFFQHYRRLSPIDTAITMIADYPAAPDTNDICETRWPYSTCTCGAYRLQWQKRNE